MMHSEDVQLSTRVRPQPLTPSTVTLLQAIRSYPAVSLLMSTTPSRRMLPTEADRLRGLAREAESRLATEALPGVLGTIVGPLTDLVEVATRGPATEAIGVFVSGASNRLEHLNVSVMDRVVVDATFATRDLVRALHRTPRHLVLALTQHGARLFDGVGDDLRPAPGRLFPRVASGAELGGHVGGELRAHQRRAFYRDVDRALGAYLQVNPAPLVLVGAARELAEFRGLSNNLSRLAGCVDGSLVTAPVPHLLPLIRSAMENYLLSRQQEALDLLDQRISAGRAVSGVQSAWVAALTGRPEMLAVEEGYFYPARIDGSGQLLSPAEDIEHPDVIDDVVDELIEIVLRRGGWVALTEDGSLAGHERVALTMHR